MSCLFASISNDAPDNLCNINKEVLSSAQKLSINSRESFPTPPKPKSVLKKSYA